jgi:hypothetical protein
MFGRRQYFVRWNLLKKLARHISRKLVLTLGKYAYVTSLTASTLNLQHVL